jgi:hypothetical protein
MLTLTLLDQWLVFLWTRVLSLTKKNDADNSDGFTRTVPVHGWDVGNLILAFVPVWSSDGGGHSRE